MSVIPSMDTAQAAASALVKIGARRVLLYGSVARGDQREGSDLDLVAVFDDLNALRTKDFADYIDCATMPNSDTSQDGKIPFHDLRGVAEDLVRKAVGECEFDLKITDRTTWKMRSAVPSLIEHLIESDHVVLVDLPAEIDIDWDSPSSGVVDNASVAEMMLDGARSKLGVGLITVECTTGWPGDSYEGQGFYNIMEICTLTAGAARMAVSGYLAGVHHTRGAKIRGVGRFSEVWDKVPDEVAFSLENSLAVPVVDFDGWDVVFGTGTASVDTVIRMTPQYGADTIRSSLSLCRFASEELSGIVEHDLLGEFMELEDTSGLLCRVIDSIEQHGQFSQQDKDLYLAYG